jgi:hypothetical protein
MWAEDEDVWLAQSLIVACVGTVKNCGFDCRILIHEAVCEGEFFAGLDLAQTRDYCVLAVVERLNESAVSAASKDLSAAHPLPPKF